MFDHAWLGSLFADDEAQAIWSADRQLSHMLAFESAWSRALGSAGLVEKSQADQAARSIEAWTPDLAILRDGTARDGLPVPALVRALKEAAGDAASAVHVGSTSQDVMDSALAITLRETSDLIERRLQSVRPSFAALDERAGAAQIMGHTRMQPALTITFVTRIAAWSAPFERHRERLGELRPRVERVQIGGPVGDRRDIAPQMVGEVAQALGLAAGPCWHAERDGIADYASLLSLIAQSCGKVGADVALMAQGGTARLAGSGSSSAMAHKQNPVPAELLVTLARYASTLIGGLHSAVVHEQERSGAAWTLEWMLLPPLAVAACRSLAVLDRVLNDLELSDGAGP